MSTRETRERTTESMRLTQSALQNIADHIGSHRAERGAMLGADRDGVICRIEPDFGARRNSVEYSPDIVHLNQIIKEWKREGISFAGFAHSHPPGFRRPSASDHEYSERILEHFDALDHVWLPIVQTIPDTGRFEIIPFASVRNGGSGRQARIEPAHLVVVRDSAITAPAKERDEVELVVREDRFARIRAGFDIERHARTRLVFIGAGGGASLVTNCARMGFADFVLIDPQNLEPANIATQQANPDCMGMAKVDALAEQVRRINHDAGVLAVARGIEDFTDSDFQDALYAPVGSTGRTPDRTVLLVLTDNFYAQARGHRLGLQFGIPTLCAQEYREGRGAKVAYTVPGVTPACHRCITSSRYNEYLVNNFSNDVTSAGAPVFAAEFLNAVIGHLLLAIVYHGTEHPRFGGTIQELGNRNLVQLRLDPQFEFARGLSAGNSATSLMFDSVFLSQTPDHGQDPARPPCPDCGGTGDLRDVKGSFSDTRMMRPPTVTRLKSRELVRTEDLGETIAPADATHSG